MTVTAITVQDMHCGACQNKLSRALANLVPVSALVFNSARRQIVIDHPNSVGSNQLLLCIEEAGFHPTLNGSRQADDDRSLLKRLGIAGLAAMQVMMLHIALYAGELQGMLAAHEYLLEYAALVFCIPVVSYCAIPFFSSALRGLRYGINMDAPIALAIAIAFSISLLHTLQGSGEVYYDSVVMFTFLLLGARYIDQRLRLQLQVENDHLAQLPKTVTIVRQGQRQAISLSAARVGDELWVGEGDQIPLDGQLLSNSALIEAAMLTGETDWQPQAKGDELYAGTFNRGPGFAMRVGAPAGQSRLADLAQLAQDAQQSKQGMVAWADRVAKVFVPSILAIAALTYLIWWQLDPGEALPAALAVLVVSCPCALSLAVPAAMTAAQTRLRQLGCWLRHPQALEQAAKINAVLLDKTGTLTTPQSEIVAQHTVGAYSASHCLAYATALQQHSNHPLARAFRQPEHPLAHHVQRIDGCGLEGTINGARVRVGTAEFCAAEDSTPGDLKRVYLSIDGHLAAYFDLGNPLRADAKAMIDAFKAEGIAPCILSGDHQRHCQRVAQTLDIPFIAEALPESKYAHVQPRDDVMYVGDGINDLPSLAAAGISAATLETTDLVKSKADVLLLSKRLTSLVAFLRIAKLTRRVVRQNLHWALAYNLIAIPLAALGLAPPWAAALGMSISSLIVMVNALRILRGV